MTEQEHPPEESDAGANQTEPDPLPEGAREIEEDDEKQDAPDLEEPLDNPSGRLEGE